MQKYVMYFHDFIDKYSSQAWVKKYLEPDREDDCLGDLRYVFYTGCKLTSNQMILLREHCPFLDYEVRDC